LRAKTLNGHSYTGYAVILRSQPLLNRPEPKPS
jgi:hypothetical protein